MGRKQQVLLYRKISEWKKVLAGMPQGSVLCPLLFLVYINDLCDNLSCAVKLFADDKSLFSVVENEVVRAGKLNGDLKTVRLWVWQWKMEFSVDKTEEIIFSTKRTKPSHPPLSMDNI